MYQKAWRPINANIAKMRFRTSFHFHKRTCIRLEVLSSGRFVVFGAVAHLGE